jgi:hypothetical protein
MLRKLMQAKEPEDSEDYEVKSVLVGTSTVSVDDQDDNADDQITTSTLSAFEKGKEHLQNVENIINDVSTKLKGKCIFLSNQLLALYLLKRNVSNPHYFLILVPSWAIVLTIFMILIVIICVIYLFFRKLIMKIFKKGDKNGKGGVDLKSMPLLGNTFKDKVI